MFDIHLGEHGEVICEGRLDASEAPKAQAFLDALPALDVIDLSRLEYISSAGLGVLLRTQKRVQQRGSGLRLVKANRHVRNIFHYSGFDRIFEIENGG
jgi:anti-sigma B factor antagonist